MSGGTTAMDATGNGAPNGLRMTVFVHDELGLHARPAARIAQAAQQFQAEILLVQGAIRADAKSILDILSLAASRGAALTLQCAGADAADAMKAISAFFQHASEEGS